MCSWVECEVVLKIKLRDGAGWYAGEMRMQTGGDTAGGALACVVRALPSCITVEDARVRERKEAAPAPAEGAR